MRLYAFFLLFSTTKSHITRLPCVHYAKFISEKGKYRFGTVVEAIDNISEKGCAMKCIANPSCVLSNYKLDGTKCDLMSVVEETSSAKPNWSTLSTDVGDLENVGPTCERFKPCEAGSRCRDFCENGVLKFMCFGYPNIAKTAEGSWSKSYSASSFMLKDCIDGDISSTCITANTAPSWLKLDLKYIVFVESVEIHNRPGYEWRLAGVMLKFSLTDQVIENYELVAEATNAKVQTIQCNKEARYTLLIKYDGDHLNINEFMVLLG